MTPQRFRNRRCLILSLAVLAAAPIGGVVREVTLLHRDARLQSAFRVIAPGTPLIRAFEHLGCPPATESVDEVVVSGPLLMSPQNPRARNHGPAHEYHILVWHGGRQRLTILADADGYVRSRKLWTTTVQRSFWRRLAAGLTGWF
ncbi:MAG: hypothetical protein RIK87_28650 [Fuerstiella sp.]